MEEQGQPEPVELVRDLGVEEGQQPAHLIQAVHLGVASACGGERLGPAWVGGPDAVGRATYPSRCRALPHLGAERRLFVEIAMHELTVLPGGDLAARGGGAGGVSGPWAPCWHLATAGTPARKAVALC